MGMNVRYGKIQWFNPLISIESFRYESVTLAAAIVLVSPNMRTETSGETETIPVIRRVLRLPASWLN